MQEPVAVVLKCPTCPRRDRDQVRLTFDGPPPAFVWDCKRGHTWKARPLTREQRRKYKREHHQSAPPVVATPWERPSGD